MASYYGQNFNQPVQFDGELILIYIKILIINKNNFKNANYAQTLA